MTDTRRKITFHLNPETNKADRVICAALENVPRADRGRVMRLMLLTGGLFHQQDERSIAVLGELLSDNTTLSNAITALRALFPAAFADAAAAPLATATPEPDPAPVDETKAGMKNMFGQS